MNERESDPTGAFHGGSAGLEDGPTDNAGTEYERHAPDGGDPGGGRPNTGTAERSETPGYDREERETIVGGAAATSELGDPDAQEKAERQGDGTPLPR